MRLGIFSKFLGRPPHKEEPQPDLDRMLAESLRTPVIGEIYPDDAPDSTALITDARERILRNSHFFSDTWFRTNTLNPEQKDTICCFLHELGNVVRNRGVILTSDVIDHLAEMLRNNETDIAYWQEPWMVPYKITRRRAVDLFEHLLAHTAATVPFHRLAECGVKSRWARDYSELGDRLRADSMDGNSLIKVFHSALIRVARQDDRSDVRSICYTMDYALACMGDRSAMMRVSETLRRICVPEGDDLSLVLTIGRLEELALVSDSWRRLSSVVRSRPMGDGERELAEMLAPVRMDMRKLDAYFEDKPGWVLPPENVVPMGHSDRPDPDWRITLFTASPDLDTGAAIRPSAAANARRLAAMMELFSDAEVAAKLKKSASGDVRWNKDADEELEAISKAIDLIRSRKKRITSMEVMAAAFAQALQQKKAASPFGLYDGSVACPASSTPVDESVVGRTTSMTDTSFPDPGKEKLVFDEALVGQLALPTMKVLDGIGESEASNKGSASASFGRLLEPFEIRPSERTADEVHAALSAEFPWMREANEFAARAVAFSGRTASKGFRLEPLLLHGLPGIGKNRWVRRLAEITGIPAHSSGLSGMNGTMSIVGSERGWASARPSLPAYAFLSTSVANPLIYVDEVDKATRGETVSDAFLPMIEKETARKYADIYLLGNMDLTAASFMFSANDLSLLSQEFLSRVKILNIRVPNENEIASVIRAMVAEICAESLMESYEAEAMAENLVSRSTEIFLKTTNLREVGKFIRSEVERSIWSPPGPRLVR
jgi:ATP-dependent Lon protease, bacterial type